MDIEKLNSKQPEKPDQIDWEAELQKLGMPAEPLSEQEIAAQAGVELKYTDDMEELDDEAKLIVEKLREQGPHEKWGGFPVDSKSLVATIKTLTKEWEDKGIPKEKIKVIIHKSCGNGADCVTAFNGTDAFHYNTGHIAYYDREQITNPLSESTIPFVEK